NRYEHVVGIQRWRVAHRASFAFEYSLPTSRRGVEPVWIRRRLDGIDKLAEGIHRFVAETMLEPALALGEELMRADRAVVSHTDKDRVSGDVFRASIDVCSGVIDVTP